MKLKQTGSVFLNHGLWYYSVQLPGESRRRQVPLRAPGAKRTLSEDRPRKMAEEAAARYWEEHTRATRRHEQKGITVAELVAQWDRHCKEVYRDADGKPTSTAINSVTDVRLFRQMFADASLAELTHTDMLKLRDALVRTGVSRKTINARLWRVKYMLTWALDEALISATVKAELTQVKGLKRGRTSARERMPVRPVDDAIVAMTLPHMMPNTADMVRLHRVTGMRPCEICAMTWADIDITRKPWVYRVRAGVNKNAWRGEFGIPRVVCLGPRAREILSRHADMAQTARNAAIFSPQVAMLEYVTKQRAERKTPFYGANRGKENAPHVPRKLCDHWVTNTYTHTIRAACERANITPWGANRLRHTFGTEVRRAFGLEAARAVLGHTEGGSITDVYSFDAIEEETIKAASVAVEALG